MYDYFIDLAPTFAHVLRFLLFLPGGNRAEGLKEIERAAATAHVVRTQARLELVQIYALLEGRPADAIAKARPSRASSRGMTTPRSRWRASMPVPPSNSEQGRRALRTVSWPAARTTIEDGLAARAARRPVARRGALRRVAVSGAIALLTQPSTRIPIGRHG